MNCSLNMKKYLFIVLLVGVSFGQLDSGNVNIDKLVKSELKKDVNQLSIGKVIQRSCCGACAYGFLGFAIMPEIGFWGILLGAIYPNIAKIKKEEQRLLNSESRYPKNIISKEQKIRYNKKYDEEKKKITNRSRNKSCIVGAIGFFTIMHIFMNTDVYFGWFPTAG